MALPIITYIEFSTDDLKPYDCADETCSSGTVRTLDNGAPVGSSIRIAARPNGR